MRRLIREDQGLSTVEYIIILILIALLGILVWSAFGEAITNQITGATSEVDSLSGSGGQAATAGAAGTGAAAVGSSGSANGSGTSGPSKMSEAKTQTKGGSGGSGGTMSNASAASGVSKGGSGVDTSAKSSNAVVSFSQDGQVTEDKSSFPLAWVVGGAFLVLAVFLGIRMGKSKTTGGA